MGNFEGRVNRLFRAPGVLRRGHFVLTSGLHSDLYFDKRIITANGELCREAAELMADMVDGHNPEVIVSPEAGAVPLGKEVVEVISGRLGHHVDFVSAKKNGGDNFWLEESDLALIRGKRIVVVEDVLTTGTSAAQVLDALSAGQQSFLPLAVIGLLDRSNGAARRSIPSTTKFLTLRTVGARSWSFEQCRTEGLCACGERICIEPRVGHGDTFVAAYGQPPYKQ